MVLKQQMHLTTPHTHCVCVPGRRCFLPFYSFKTYSYLLLACLVGDAQVAAVGLQRRLHLWRVASQQRRCLATQRLAHVGLQHGLCTARAWGCSLWRVGLQALARGAAGSGARGCRLEREVHVAAAPS